MAVSLEPVAQAICGALGCTYSGQAGEGAFKQTFRVEQHGQPRALKVYNPGFPVERTQRELNAVMRCRHPNIGTLSAASIFDTGTEQFLFTLEDFLEGGTLSTRTAAGRLLQPAEGKAIGAQLIDAVAHIASHHFVHRDIKPDNILFKADGRTPVLVDFGLVRDLRDSSLTQTWLLQGPGTPLFAPAEQLLNDKDLIGWRSDQFSLGVTLSYAIFGAHPYSDTGLTNPEIVGRVAERRPPGTWFVERANAVGLTALPRMVNPWPIERFRTPADLATAWANQNT